MKSATVLSVALGAACTYGPDEQTGSAAQIQRLGDSYRAIVVVRRDRFRRPTGLSAFPDGGKWRYSARAALYYLVDARERDVVLLAEQEAPDEVWESFDARIVGLDGDSVAFVRLTGCPRAGECHPRRQRSMVHRLSTHGELRGVDSVPSGAGLPGEMIARSPGEEHYVRFGTRGDMVTARFEDGGEPEPLFRVLSDGVLRIVGR
jgi:hypothetical protein